MFQLRPKPKSQMPSRPSPPPYTTLSLLRLTFAMAGIQICYAAQFNLITPHLLYLGLPPSLVSLAWLAAPLSGLVVQPFVGMASDACTHRLGRRRPFIIVGAVLTAAFMALFANAEVIAAVANPLFAARDNRKLALILAMIAFVGLDCSVQAVQAPLRALLSDVLPQNQFAKGNAYIGMFTGVGNLAGSLLVGMHLSNVFRHLTGWVVSDVQAVFCIAALLLLLCVAVTCVYTKEKVGRGGGSVVSQMLNAQKSRGTPTRESVTMVLRGIPRPFWQVFAVQLCTWSGFFTLFVFLNSWVGTNIFLGDPTATPGSAGRHLYESGVRLGGMANALMAVVTMSYAVLLPHLLELFGVLPVYMFSQFTQAFVLISAFFLRGHPPAPTTLLKALTIADVSAFGIVWATTVTLPWTLIARALNSDPVYAKHFGLFTTLFNASQSFPQLVVAFIAPVIMAVQNDPAAVMLLGGVVGLVGAVLAWYFRVDQEATPVDAEQDKEGEPAVLLKNQIS